MRSPRAFRAGVEMTSKWMSEPSMGSTRMRSRPDDLFGRDRGARKVGGEEQVVHLKRAPLALARVAAVAEQLLGAAVLEQDFVVHVGEDDGVGHRLHDRLDPLPLALELADGGAEALDVGGVREDGADAVGVAREQRELRVVELGAARADVERAGRERLREPEALLAVGAQRAGDLARGARVRGELPAEEREREQVRAAPICRGIRGRLVVAREPCGAPVMDDAHVRRVRVEREFEPRERLVVREPGRAAHAQRRRGPVDEGERRARVPEPGRQRVEHERGLLVEALRGEELRRHLEEQLVLVQRQQPRAPSAGAPNACAISAGRFSIRQ